LELLEELLQEYQGTLLLVSHDRAFINNVVTSTLVFQGDGKITEYVGGYDEILHGPKEEKQISAESAKPQTRQKPKGPRKLSFNEKKELAELPKQIETYEAELDEINGQMSSPEFYKQPSEKITKTTARMDFLTEQLSKLYSRWEHLEQFPE
jgi:ATP-binding cassette subfamily F protein uup